MWQVGVWFTFPRLKALHSKYGAVLGLCFLLRKEAWLFKALAESTRDYFQLNSIIFHYVPEKLVDVTCPSRAVCLFSNAKVILPSCLPKEDERNTDGFCSFHKEY